MKSDFGKNRAMIHSLLVICATAVSCHAFAENGGGYNGPVTQGEAIPAKLDRAITLERLTQVMKGCQDEMKMSFIRQVAHMTPEAFDAAYTVERDNDSPEWSFKNLSSTSSFNAEYLYFSRFQSTPKTLKPANGPVFKGSMSIQISNSSSGVDNGTFYLSDPKEFSSASFKLPKVSFDNTIKDGKADENGDVLTSSVIIKGLKFLIPEDYKDEVRLVNDKTGLESAYVVSPKAYLDCLFAEVQK